LTEVLLKKHMAKGGSRPTSHNSRPETASRKKRDEERRDKMTVDSQVTPIEEDLEHSKQMEAGNKKHSRDEKQESKEDRKINSHSNAQQNLIDQQFHSRQKSASMEVKLSFLTHSYTYLIYLQFFDLLFIFMEF
jgi:hypothetical protein